MPEIKVAHIVSFSSEDKNQPAQNLLKQEGTSKWRSGAVGEQNVTCVLQLEKAVKICQVDIGNEGAAFVEVLTGRSSGREADFQVLLVASSFMNPTESRSGQNLNRVRIFTADKLNATLLDEKWDRVKVVCSQPFNKSIKYGLSFIKFHSPSEGPETPVPKQTSLGAFKLKSEEPPTDIKTGSLFANRHKGEADALTGAAAVRAASKHVEEDQKLGTTKTSVTPSRRHSQTASTSHTASNMKRKHDEHKTEHVDKKAREDRQERGDKPGMNRHSNSTDSVASSKSHSGTPPPSKKNTKTTRSDEGETCSFKSPMKNVVFVLSGYQNPERGNIRDCALEMGATYRPVWGPGCTHLICAFSNTPKFSEVRKKGRIVTSRWITKSYKRQKLLPWRDYRLANAPTPPGSSASESEEELVQPTRREASGKHSLKRSQELDSDDPVLYEGSTDDEDDTGDEIDRVRAAAAQNDASPSASAGPSASVTSTQVIELGSSTSEDEHSELPELPDFFSGKRFLLYGSLSPVERRSLLRFIIAYNGKVENYMSEEVHYVISNNSWDDHFDDALSENPNLAFVRPNWITACNEKQRLMPHQKYVIVPTC